MQESHSDPDAHLLEDLRSGDGEKAVAALLPRIKKWIICHHSVLLEDSEDLAGETLVRAYQHIEGFKGNGKFYTWLIGIAKNVVCEYMEKHRHDNGISLDEWMERNHEAEAEDDPEAMAINRWVAEDALDCLNENQRQIIQLRFWSRLSNKEIGERMGKTPNAIQCTIYDAMIHMKQHFKETGYL